MQLFGFWSDRSENLALGLRNIVESDGDIGFSLRRHLGCPMGVEMASEALDEVGVVFLAHHRARHVHLP